MNDAANAVLVSGTDSQSLKASCARMAADFEVEFVATPELLDRLQAKTKPCVVVLDAGAAAQLPSERSDNGWPIILVILGQHEQEPMLDARSVHGFIRLAFGTDEVVRLINACVDARSRLARDTMGAVVIASSATLLGLLS